MKMPVLERTSAAKAGWLIILLTVGWMGFVLWPDPAKKKAAQPAAIPVPPSKLLAVGLPDNPDLAGLPDYFAVWSDSLEWVDDKTQFAYWNPGSHSYSYFFEATRRDGRYRFRPMPRQKIGNRSLFYVDEDQGMISDEVPELKAESPTHPFVFSFPIAFFDHVHDRPVLKPGILFKPKTNEKVKVEVAPIPLVLPKPTIPKP